jgi:hypothetical protein
MEVNIIYFYVGFDNLTALLLEEYMVTGFNFAGTGTL